MSDQPGPSSSSTVEVPLKNEEECRKLLCHGEVLIIRHRYPEAVDALEECVRNLARIHGEGHDAIGDAYLYYGRALLGAEQMDESLFQKDEAAEEDGEDSDEEDEEQEDGEENGENEEGGEENGEDEEGGEENGTEEGKEVEADGEVKENGEASAKPSALESVELDGENTDSPAPADASSSEDVAAPAEGAEAAATEQEDQITNMQVAWEVTELARKIFLARGSDNIEDVKKLGRAYATLAEIAMISGQYAESAADFGRAYEILVKTDDDTLREQAEVLYLRSNALVSSNRFDDAKDALKLALDKLSAHQEVLRQKTEADSTKEIEEVESLKQQLSGKFDEIEIAREDIAKFRQQKEKIGLSNGAGPSGSPVKPAAALSNGAGSGDSGEKPVVRDISHLVRRRKKPDADGDGASTSEESNEVKKAKVDVPETENPAPQVEVNGLDKKEEN